MSRVSNEIEQLATELGELKTVNSSAVALLDKLFSLMESNIGDETKLREIIAEARSQKADLAAGVARNTVADGETPTE